MSVNITFDGQSYIVPETGEVGWGGNTTSYLVAIAAGCLQKTGGSFTLSAETDFGADFGLQSLYYKSRTASVADAGIIRFANNSDAVTWRNAADGANLALLVDSSDRLSYNGSPVLTGTGPSDYAASITGTANQIIASAATGAITLSTPQDIDTGATTQFGLLGLGSVVDSKSVLSLTSTTRGFLPPRLTTAQQDAIVSPTTGLTIYNSTLNQITVFDGTVWQPLAMSGGGTVISGSQFQLGYYAAGGTTISPLTLLTGSRALSTDVNGLPVASATTDTELGYVSGVTSAIQSQLDLKAPLSSPTFTGTITLPVTASRALATDGSSQLVASAATDTELGYLSGVTSAIQTQLNAKAADSLVVHLAGIENITGAKTFSAPVVISDTIDGITLGATNTNATSGCVLAVTGNTISSDTANTRLIAKTIAGPIRETTLQANGVGLIKSSLTTGGLMTVTINSFNGSEQRGISINDDGVVAARGTITNDSPVAGDIGEVISSYQTRINTPATTVWGDLTSISLSTGDWLVHLNGDINCPAAITDFDAGVSLTPGNSATGLVIGDNHVSPRRSFIANDRDGYAITGYQIQLAATTTIYLKYRSTFASTIPQMSGRLTAERIR